MPRLRGGQLSTNPRAIARREAARAGKRANLNIEALTPTDITSNVNGISSEPIGIKPVGEGQKENMPNDYECGNCQSPVTLGLDRCETCESALRWEGIG